MTQSEQLKKERMYVLLLAAVQFCHMLDFVVLMPLGPTLMEKLSISPSQFAALVSSYNFSAAFSGILIGTIADRFDRKLILVFALIGFFAGTFACGLSNTYSTLLTARIITGSFGGVLNALVFAMVTDLVPFERRGKAMGTLMSSFSVASVLGVPLGLTISDYFGWQMTFFYIASIATIITLLSFMYLPSLKDKIHSARGLQILKNFVTILIKKEYLIGHAFILSVGMSMFFLIPFLSPIAVKNFGIATYHLKYMYLVGGAFTIVTARLLGKWTDQFGPFLIFKYLAIAAVFPILLYTHLGPLSLFWYLALSTTFMTVVSGRMIPTMTLLSRLPEEKERGTFMGVLNAVRSLGSASAAMLSGLIIYEGDKGTLLGTDHAGFISIGLIFISMIIAFRLNKRLGIDQLPSTSV